METEQEETDLDEIETEKEYHYTYSDDFYFNADQLPIMDINDIIDTDFFGL